MTDYVTLMGSEDVSRAGHNMGHAAEAMQRAALQFEATVERLIRALDEHAIRVEYAMRASSAQAQPPAASVPDGFLRHVAAVCMGAVENCRPKASLIPEDPQEHNGGLCLNELTHIADEIDRMLAAQENPNG